MSNDEEEAEPPSESNEEPASEAESPATEPLPSETTEEEEEEDQGEVVETSEEQPEEEEESPSEEPSSSFDLSEIDFSAQEGAVQVETTSLIFNGFDMSDRSEKLKCQIDPAGDGNYIQMEIKLVDYEIMCKYVAVDDFCRCETDGIEVIDEAAVGQVYDEFFITRTD